MYRFNSILQKSKNKYSKKMLKDLYYSEISAQPFFKLVKEYFNEMPDASNSEAFETFFEKFNTSNEELSLLPTIKSDTLRLNICNYLVNNPKELKIAYDKVHREEEKGKSIDIKDSVSYSSNKLVSTRLAVLQAISAIRQYKSTIPEDFVRTLKIYLNSPKKVQNGYRNNMDSASRRQLSELKDYFDGDEYTQVYTFLKKRIPEFERDLKEDYIQSLMYLGSKFKEFGLLEKYCKDQSRILDRLNMKELEYPVNEEENTNGSITVEELFEKETLEKMSINKLSVLNSFWMNRYTKELRAMNQSFFIVNSLNLWSSIKSAERDSETGRIKIDIDENELENLFLKMYFLHETSRILLEEIKQEDIEDSNNKIVVSETNGRINTARKIETTEYIYKLCEDLSSEYSEYFESLDPELLHDFLGDFDCYRVIDNSIYNAYRLKDMNMIAILSNLQKNNFSKNWGIILEDKNDIKTSNKVLLGIDVEGFNMPIRLHIDKSVIAEFFKANQNNTIVPVYEGADDFKYQGKIISTQILMPISKAQEKGLKQIEERQSVDSSTKNLFEHLKFLKDFAEYPEHLKEEKVVRKKGKSKIVRKPPEKRFIDLSANKLYNKDKDGTFVEIVEAENEKGEQYE